MTYLSNLVFNFSALFSIIWLLHLLFTMLETNFKDEPFKFLNMNENM